MSYLRLQIGISKTRAYYVWGLRTPSKFITNLPPDYIAQIYNML